MDNESDCVITCLALHKSGGCEAYKWNALTRTCFIQDTLNITQSADCSPTDLGMMLPKDFTMTTCPEGYYKQACNVSDSCERIRTDHECAADCADIVHRYPTIPSGVYSIKLAGTGQMKQVWCDMDTDGGGWTVFLKRIDGSVDFYQDLATYTEGFGDVNGEYWLGLDALHAITTAKTYQLRADMSDWAGESAHSSHASVVVADASDDYRWTVGAFLGGDGGDCMSRMHNNMRFSTKDEDRDGHPGKCAISHKRGFWYNHCVLCNPTGIYYNGGVYTSDKTDGIQWRTWDLHDDDGWYSVKTLDMKLRP